MQLHTLLKKKGLAAIPLHGEQGDMYLLAAKHNTSELDGIRTSSTIALWWGQGHASNQTHEQHT